MNQTYQQDPNNQQIQTAAVAQPPVQPSPDRSMMTYIKDNKWLILIGILILAALIWWFCIRKKAASGTDIGNAAATNAQAAAAGTGANATTNSGIRMAKTRLGNNNAGALID